MARPDGLALALVLMLAAGPAAAQEDPEAAALALADRTLAKAETARAWQLALEAALERSSARADGALLHGRRVSLELQLDYSPAPGWRAVFADGLDVRRQDGSDTVNTLKEAYLSWQPRPEQVLDLGRVNARYGVATGYNPTDFLRAGATRSVTSIDPASLKKNRLGSVMLRGQTLWEGGALTALFSPRLADAPSDAPFSADLGATNERNRWLLALSQRLSGELQPQWLLYGEQGRPAQLGMNLTYLLGKATVAHLEWSGGRSAPQLAQALQADAGSAFRSRLSAGLSHTTSDKLLLTAEFEYNGAALTRDQWEALGRGPAPPYLRYRQWVQQRQEMATRRSLFLYARWQDALRERLDLNAMLRLNADDHSRLSWLEARYHWDRAEAALQWQYMSGRPGSEFGALPQRQAVQVLLRYFF